MQAANKIRGQQHCHRTNLLGAQPLVGMAGNAGTVGSGFHHPIQVRLRAVLAP